MSRRAFSSLIVLALAFVLVPVAAAGGWSIVTVDQLPGEVHAGESLRLGFMVLQHGKTPINQVEPYLEAYNPESGETVRANAVQEGSEGHFVVEIVFPAAGIWEWEIVPAPFGGTQLEPLSVLPAVLPQAAASPDQALAFDSDI
ncbi:MAG: hypothetical protein ACRDHG_13465, partial [Anaerolineales bacterium]